MLLVSPAVLGLVGLWVIALVLLLSGPRISGCGNPTYNIERMTIKNEPVSRNHTSFEAAEGIPAKNYTTTATPTTTMPPWTTTTTLDPWGGVEDDNTTAIAPLMVPR